VKFHNVDPHIFAEHRPQGNGRQPPPAGVINQLRKHTLGSVDGMTRSKRWVVTELEPLGSGVERRACKREIESLTMEIARVDADDAVLTDFLERQQEEDGR